MKGLLTKLEVTRFERKSLFMDREEIQFHTHTIGTLQTNKQTNQKTREG